MRYLYIEVRVVVLVYMYYSDYTLDRNRNDTRLKNYQIYMVT